jgi:hypothetical protein
MHTSITLQPMPCDCAEHAKGCRFLDSSCPAPTRGTRQLMPLPPGHDVAVWDGSLRRRGLCRPDTAAGAGGGTTDDAPKGINCWGDARRHRFAANAETERRPPGSASTHAFGVFPGPAQSGRRGPQPTPARSRVVRAMASGSGLRQWRLGVAAGSGGWECCSPHGTMANREELLTS